MPPHRGAARTPAIAAHTHANTEQHRCKLRHRLTVFAVVEPESQTIHQAQQLQLKEFNITRLLDHRTTFTTAACSDGAFFTALNHLKSQGFIQTHVRGSDVPKLFFSSLFFPLNQSKNDKKTTTNTQLFHNVPVSFYIQRETMAHLNRAKWEDKARLVDVHEGLATMFSHSLSNKGPAEKSR